MTSWPLWRHLTWIWQLDLIDRSHDLLLHADWSICTTWPISGFLIGRARSGPPYYWYARKTKMHDIIFFNFYFFIKHFWFRLPVHFLLLKSLKVFTVGRCGKSTAIFRWPPRGVAASLPSPHPPPARDLRIGDLNFDLCSEHNNVKQFKYLCDQFQLTNSIKKPTIVTESTATG